MPDAHEQGDLPTPRPAVSTHEMPDSVGAELRAAREALGQDIDDVSGALKIRAIHLDAIESGRFGDLPGQTYAIGFVRTYAKYLGLDGQDVVRRFKAEVVGLEEHPELVFRAPERDARMPFAVVAIISLLMAVAIYALWFYVIREPEPEPLSADDAPPSAVIAEPEAPETGSAAPEQPAVPAETVQPVAPAEDEAASGTVPGTLPAPEAAPAPEIGNAADDAPEAIADGDPGPAVENGSAPGAASPQANGPVAEPVMTAPQSIVIRAVDDSWVEIRADDGEILFSRVLTPGETYAVPDRSDLSMVTGNAGAIRVTVNGTHAPPLGEDGVVRRDIELTAAALMAGPGQ